MTRLHANIPVGRDEAHADTTVFVLVATPVAPGTGRAWHYRIGARARVDAGAAPGCRRRTHCHGLPSSARRRIPIRTDPKSSESMVVPVARAAPRSA